MIALFKIFLDIRAFMCILVIILSTFASVLLILFSGAEVALQERDRQVCGRVSGADRKEG